MGRVAEFKDEEILKAGLELEEREGKGKVTTSAIRNHLGGGSSTRIKKIWKNFLIQRDKEEALENSNITIELPHELQSLFEKQSDIVMKVMKQFVTESYQTSDRLSETKVKARLEEYSKQIDKLEAAEDEALRGVDEREDQIFELLEANTVLASENDKLKTQNAGLSGQIKRLEESVAKHDEVTQRLDALLKENGKLQYIVDEIESEKQNKK